MYQIQIDDEITNVRIYKSSAGLPVIGFVLKGVGYKEIYCLDSTSEVAWH